MSLEPDMDDVLDGEDPLRGLSPEQRAAVDAEREMQVRKERELTKQEKRKRRHLERSLSDAEQRYEDLLTITHGDAPRPSLGKIYARDGAKSPAAAVLVWSDWHVDSDITLGQTNGQNELTIDIAWARVRSLVQRSVWQIRSWQKTADLETIVVAALGDWIAGDIHSELVETCLPPQEATRIVREMHEYALEELHKIPGITRIAYFGIPDNHGRTTKQYQWTNGAQQSHNWGMYHALKAVCSKGGLDKIDFTISEGSIVYTDVLGHTFRFMHGHQFRYGGGVGGVGVPALKWVLRANKGNPCDYTLVGHYHQARDFGALIMNGSLCGPDAYSVQNGFESEAPTQLALLVRPGFGVCDISKIFPKDVS